MSLPKSRSEKSHSQYRKLGRSGSSGNQQRNFKAPPGGGGNGGATPAVPPTAASSFSSNRSFKKTNNAQGGQSRTNTPYVNAESSYAPAPQWNVQNGAALQPSSHATEVSAAGVSVKQIESSATQNVYRAVPKAPAPQPATVNPSSVAPTTPAKPQGDAPGGYLQFGSLSPGLIQGMQIPPRTSSAPSNFDEQKKAQARHESSKPASISSTPAPMLQVPKKETVSQGPQPVPYVSPSPLNSYSASKPGAFVPVISGPPGADRARDLHKLTPSLATVPVSVKPAPSSTAKKVTDSSPQISSGFQKGDSPKLLRPLWEGSIKPVVDVLVAASTSTVIGPIPVSSTIKAKSSTVQINTRSSSINDSQKQDERGHSQLGQQVSGQSVISSNSNTEAASVATSATGDALESTTSEVSESISGGVGEVESAIHKPDGGQKTENVETEENEGLKELPVEDTCDTQNIICNDSGSARVVTRKDHNLTLLPIPLVLSNSLVMPEGIEINAVDALFVNSRPSPRRVVDRPSGPSRSDRRLNVVEEDKWNKVSGNFVPGRDLQPESGYGSHMVRPGQRNNFGVSTYHPRSQGSGVHRNSPDERWQRAKGLISSPHTPLLVMHRAENKYKIGKVLDEEEAKQRQLKAILNKLTPTNFEKLFEKVKAVNVDNAVSLSGCISQIYDKASTESIFCEMYANFCHRLAGELPELSEDDKKVTFRRLLLNKCQEGFERGELEQEEANRTEDGEDQLSKEERETKRVQARRRMLGNIRFIGELYKKKMLTERIMHSCINKLLGQHEDPEEEDIESLCNLMSTIGEIIDHPKAKEHMDAYFDIMGNLSNNMRLSSRVRFMLKDAIDLRRNKWQQRRKVEGPKKIDEVHRDAAQERTAQASRLQSRPSMSSSVRRTAPYDFGQRSSPMLPSPNRQMGNFRGYPPQFRGHGNQDVRFDERQSYEARHMSVPLPQRPVGNDSITLGPQGGLARGMSNRGQQSLPNVSTVEFSPGHGDFGSMPGVVNGYNTSAERTTYGSREFFSSRQVSDRYAGPSDQSSGEEHYIPPGNRAGHSFEAPLATSPASRVQEPVNNLSETSFPEDRLHEKSITVIKEYYSAKGKGSSSQTSRQPREIARWSVDTTSSPPFKGPKTTAQHWTPIGVRTSPSTGHPNRHQA